jgi:hypothetical protein
VAVIVGIAIITCMRACGSAPRCGQTLYGVQGLDVVVHHEVLQVRKREAPHPTRTGVMLELPGDSNARRWSLLVRYIVVGAAGRVSMSGPEAESASHRHSLSILFVLKHLNYRRYVQHLLNRTGKKLLLVHQPVAAGVVLVVVSIGVALGLEIVD